MRLSIRRARGWVIAGCFGLIVPIGNAAAQVERGAAQTANRPGTPAKNGLAKSLKNKQPEEDEAEAKKKAAPQLTQPASLAPFFKVTTPSTARPSTGAPPAAMANSTGSSQAPATPATAKPKAATNAFAAGYVRGRSQASSAAAKSPESGAAKPASDSVVWLSDVAQPAPPSASGKAAAPSNAPSASHASSGQVKRGGFLPAEGFISMEDGQFRAASMKQPPVPSAGNQPSQFQPSPAVQPSAAVQPSIFGGLGSFAPPTPEESDSIASRHGIQTGSDVTSVAPTAGGNSDVVANLVEGRGGPTMEAQRRSAVSFDPNIRGFRGGQIYNQSNGAWWSAARPDLDSVLSKIDANTVQDIVVISGPYGLRYGPGFAFIDIVTAPTPRYCCPEIHYRQNTSFRGNGAALYTRETIYGGDQDIGFRISSGQNRGNDYWSGSPGLTKIPASYRFTDINAELGVNLAADTRLEFSALRLDQGNTDYAAQFFDLGYLVTNGYTMRLVDEDPMAPWSKAVVEGWYNETRFAGDTINKRDPAYPVMQRLEFAVDQFASVPFGTTRIDGVTSGVQTSTGVRNFVTFGDVQDAHLNVGADYRFLTQRINEDFTTNGIGGLPPSFFTNLPPGQLSDAGAFSELAMPLTSYFTSTVGVRADWVHTTANDLRTGSVIGLQNEALTQNDVLYAFYLKNSLEVDQNWTLTSAIGHGQRAPTLIERYGDGMFLGVLQSGFTRVVGTPGLKKERNWQADLGIQGEFDDFRGRLSGYHSWVIDYITYSGSVVVNPALADARLLQYINTSSPAQLFGFEAYGEYDVGPQLTTYSSMRFNRGFNTELAAALPGIFPLDSTMGMRLHDPGRRNRWSIDTFVRMVNTQDRLGVIRVPAGQNPIETRTPGFTTWNVRSYYSMNRNLNLTAGVDNILNRNYLSHLDLRLISSVNGIPPTYVLSPGITPYVGFDWNY